MYIKSYVLSDYVFDTRSIRYKKHNKKWSSLEFAFLQGICSSRLGIALKAGGQCLTRKSKRYLCGRKQSEISQIYSLKTFEKCQLSISNFFIWKHCIQSYKCQHQN